MAIAKYKDTSGNWQNWTPDMVGALGAQYTNGYYGMGTPNNNFEDWIRTTSTGLIPYKAGGASSLGTEIWPFNEAYINTMHGTATYANSSNYSNSAGNSDTVDGYHASSFVKHSDIVTYNATKSRTKYSSSSNMYSLCGLSLTGGYKYVITLWACADSVGSNNCAFGYYDAVSLLTPVETVIASSAGYAYFTYTIVYSSSSAVKPYIQARVGGSGGGYLSGGVKAIRLGQI